MALLRTFCVAFVLAVTIAGHSFAGTMLYDDRASFDANAAPLSGFESFETRLSVSPDFSTWFFPEVAVSSENGLVYIENTTWATDGVDVVTTYAYSGMPTSDITFTFDAPINAFGIDARTYSPSQSADVFVDGDLVGQVDFSGSPLVFFGFTDDMSAFESVRFVFDNPNYDPMAFDSLSFREAVTEPVPEPSSLALVGLGSLGVCGYRRRRRNAGLRAT